jgi:hypothetical protein
MSKDNTTVGNLMDEGRRYVLHVGEHYEGDGFRAAIVFEDYPFYFPTGELTNRPEAAPIIWWPTDDEDAAQEMAYTYSEQELGISRTEHRRIVTSSMAAYSKARRVTVKRNPDTDDVWLLNGFDQEMKVDGDDAVTLYQDLAKLLELPYRKGCLECGLILNEEELCEDCDY